MRGRKVECLGAHCPQSTSASRGLLLQGSRPPGSHSIEWKNYSSGQLSPWLLSSESYIFLPIFGGDLVAGQASEVSLQPGPASRRGRLPAPSELEGPRGDHQGWMLSCRGRGAKAVFFLSVPKRKFFLQMFRS